MATTGEVEHLSSDSSQGGEKRKAPPAAKAKQPQMKKNKTTQKKGVKKEPKCPYWKYYDKFIDEQTGLQRAQCKYCPKTLAAVPKTNGTTGLKRHAEICPGNPDFLMKDQTELYVKKNDGDDAGPSEIKTWKFSSEDTRKAIAEMIIVDELPFMTVEHEGFKRLMETICPNFKVPSRHTIARDCGEIYLEKKALLKSFFGSTKTRVCLTTDTWTSIQRVNYMCITAHFIDDNWVYQKRIINFKPINNHKGEEIGRLLHKCLKEWDISSVLTITTDNASSNDSAITYLKGILQNQILEGRYLHVRCMAHVINLIVKEGLREREKAVDRIRDAIRYIRISPKRLENFRTCAKKENIPTNALLCLDCPTRWNSTYEMLTRAEKFEKAFSAYDLDDPNYRKDLDNKIPTVSDWHTARELAATLEMFKRKTTFASASTYVNVHQYFREVMGMDKKIKEHKKSGDMILVSMANLMEHKFNKYWGDDKFENKFLYFATILDPRQKSRMLTLVYTEMYMAQKKEEETPKDIEKKVKLVVDQIITAMEFVFNEYELDNDVDMGSTSNSSQFQQGSEVHSDGEDEFVAKFKASGSSSSYKTKSELHKYLDDEEHPWEKGFDLLKWWKACSSRYPILSKMAKDILAIPISSVASESAFSTGGRVIDAYRSSLSTPVVESLICTQDWIRKSRIAINEDATFDDLGKEIYERLEPTAK